jgi:cation-transporting ATPase 13A3/4/5
VRRWWELADNYEGETISLVSLFQVTCNSNAWLVADPVSPSSERKLTQLSNTCTTTQLVAAPFAFNFGYLFRRSWYRNYLLVINFAFFFALITAILFADPNPIGCLLRINCGVCVVAESISFMQSACGFTSPPSKLR